MRKHVDEQLVLKQTRVCTLRLTVMASCARNSSVSQPSEPKSPSCLCFTLHSMAGERHEEGVMRVQVVLGSGRPRS